MNKNIQKYIIMLVLLVVMSVVTSCGVNIKLFDNEDKEQKESRNKDQDDNIDEDMNEKEKIDADELTDVITTSSEEMATVGNDKVGFVNIPKDYARFQDESGTSDPNLLQWSSYNSEWIVSMSVYDITDVELLVDVISSSMTNPEIVSGTEDNLVMIEDRSGDEYWVVSYKSVGDKTYYLSVETYNPEVEYLVPGILESYVQ
ncbi:MAG: hypothetical protein CVU84_04645 [Firmicutes bacterium HGW-Firmicutes-1]|jgi:hypothetical protein|nr:MAG: hypothetical protein CVU84_04645 [Firmicutes bacterium HGW-Firmicutes-1]